MASGAAEDAGVVVATWVPLTYQNVVVPPNATTDRFFPVVLVAATVVAGRAGVNGDQYQIGTATVYCRATVPPAGTVIMYCAAEVATETADSQ